MKPEIAIAVLAAVARAQVIGGPAGVDVGNSASIPTTNTATTDVEESYEDDHSLDIDSKTFIGGGKGHHGRRWGRQPRPPGTDEDEESPFGHDSAVPPTAQTYTDEGVSPAFEGASEGAQSQDPEFGYGTRRPEQGYGPEDGYPGSSYSGGYNPGGGYSGGSSPGGGYPGGSYSGGSYPGGGYSGGSYPEGASPQGSYSQGAYPEGSSPQGSSTEGSYPESSSAGGSYPGGYSAEGYPGGGSLGSGSPEGSTEGYYPEGDYLEGGFTSGAYPEGSYSGVPQSEGFSGGSASESSEGVVPTDQGEGPASGFAAPQTSAPGSRPQGSGVAGSRPHFRSRRHGGPVDATVIGGPSGVDIGNAADLPVTNTFESSVTEDYEDDHSVDVDKYIKIDVPHSHHHRSVPFVPLAKRNGDKFPAVPFHPTVIGGPSGVDVGSAADIPTENTVTTSVDDSYEDDHSVDVKETFVVNKGKGKGKGHHRRYGPGDATVIGGPGGVDIGNAADIPTVNTATTSVTEDYEDDHSYDLDSEIEIFPPHSHRGKPHHRARRGGFNPTVIGGPSGVDIGNIADIPTVNTETNTVEESYEDDHSVAVDTALEIAKGHPRRSLRQGPEVIGGPGGIDVGNTADLSTANTYASDTNDHYKDDHSVAITSYADIEAPGWHHPEPRPVTPHSDPAPVAHHAAAEPPQPPCVEQTVTHTNTEHVPVMHTETLTQTHTEHVPITRTETVTEQVAAPTGESAFAPPNPGFYGQIPGSQETQETHGAEQSQPTEAAPTYHGQETQATAEATPKSAAQETEASEATPIFHGAESVATPATSAAYHAPVASTITVMDAASSYAKIPVYVPEPTNAFHGSNMMMASSAATPSSSLRARPSGASAEHGPKAAESSEVAHGAMSSAGSSPLFTGAGVQVTPSAGVFSAFAGVVALLAFIL